MHDDHEHKENDQIPREQGDGDMLCDQAEHRRHAHRPDIGAGHLHADDGLRLVFAEIRRRGVDDARINRRAAESDDHQTDNGAKMLRQR